MKIYLIGFGIFFVGFILGFLIAACLVAAGRASRMEEEIFRKELQGGDVMIKLGQIARDKLTGFRGIVVAETHYLTGCTSYGVLPLTLKKDEGTPQDWVWIDSGRLEESKEEIGAGGGPDNPSAPQSD